VTVRGLVAHPVLSILIGTVWLALNESFGVPQLLVAIALGLGLPIALRGFLARGGHIGRLDVALKLVVVVLRDIVVSNIVVARIVLDPWATPRPAWVEVRLDIRDPLAIALLATIITTTPGTVSCVVDEAGRVLHVHALDCADPAAMAADIKARYERPLGEILG
jgi:multicomponent K+:H+ antiporter subunit E